jgi:hypothetical protein
MIFFQPPEMTPEIRTRRSRLPPLVRLTDTPAINLEKVDGETRVVRQDPRG